MQAALRPDGWTCHRAQIPDASWSAAARAEVSRADSLHRMLGDYTELARVARVPGASCALIGLLGFSYGGYMTAFLSAAKPARLLVLRCPAIYPDADWDTPKEHLDKQALEDYRARRLGPRDNKALWCCAQFRGDVLLIDAEHDEVIAPTVIQSYERSFRSVRSLTRLTLDGADHKLSDTRSQRQYQTEVVRWLNARC